jgi:CheY-like chemotaxis protein
MNSALQKILVVEDSADIRIIVKLALGKVGGLDVCLCASGDEALKRVAEFQPQLILLDVMMPDMDGPTVLKHLRETPATAAIPVVFLTAKTSAQEVQMLRSLGALDVVAKPFDPMTLHQQIKDIWQGAVGAAG